MLKTILLAFIIHQVSQSESQFVSEFHNLNNKQEEELYINTYKNSSVDADAYVLALEMKKAEYTLLPWRKWNIFHTQKKRLNQLITFHPQNVHLRYIRLVLQEHSPAFLGYNEHVEEDKTFLQFIIDQKDSTDYMDNYIKQYTSL